MRYPIMLTALILLGSFAPGCALNPSAQRPNPDELLLPSFEDLLPDGRPSVGPLPNASSSPGSEGLIASLSRLGIRLSNDELAQLRTLTSVKPTGRWSRSQTQTAEQNLLANYRRFNPLFTPEFDSAEEYRVRAVSFAEKASVPYYFDLQYYLDNRRILIVKWDEVSGEFIVVQADGTLVNYLVTKVIQPPRYLKVDI